LLIAAFYPRWLMTLGLFGLAIILILVGSLAPVSDRGRNALITSGIIVLIVGVVLVVIGALGWVDVGPFYHSTRL
jgi:hypothetical protein